MGRRVSSGVVGGTGLGSLSVVSSTISSTTANGDITLDPNGTGVIQLSANTQLPAQNDLRFADSDSSNYVAIQGPSTVSANYTLTLPSAIAGTNGLALTSDTSGNLSWAAAGAALADNNSDSGTNYLVFTTQTTGFLTASRVATTTRPLSYQPSTGTLTSTILAESSSIALKENFSAIDNALNKILQLQAWTYDRKDGSNKNEPGLVAEEVAKVIPNVVSLDDEGKPISIAYSRLTAYLVESIKELKKEIENLRR